MNAHFILLGMVLVNIALAAAAVIQRDRSLLLAWAGSCLLSTILLFFTYPVLAVLKLVLLILMARHLITIYNSIINLDQNAELRLHDVASSLVRREAVVPRIQSFVQQYSNYEASTLVNTIRERGGRGGGLAVVFENYPALRASEQFTRLAAELVAAEEQILAARYQFNEAVAAHNRYLRQFPTLLFARAMAFRERDYLTA
jgi:LemA protein